MTNPRRLARVRITHEMLTTMIQKSLIVVKEHGYPNDLEPGEIDMADVIITGVHQDRAQMLQGTAELFIESPELPIVELYSIVPIMPCGIREENDWPT